MQNNRMDELTDRACLLSWESMLEKTAEYCVWRDSVDGRLFNEPWIGWWVSKEAVIDMDWFVCLN